MRRSIAKVRNVYQLYIRHTEEKEKGLMAIRTLSSAVPFRSARTREDRSPRGTYVSSVV